MVENIGQFVWHELLADDASAAAEFYAHVVDWQSGDAGAGHGGCTLMGADGHAVARVTRSDRSSSTDQKAGGWIAYASVADVDAAVKIFVELGGSVHRASTNDGGNGSSAVVTDPQGALIGLLTTGARASGHGGPNALGQATWHELYADDPDGAFHVYAGVLGWERGVAFNMGPAGPYQVIAAQGGQIGGIMRRPPPLPKPYWNVFFQVDGMTAAQRRVEVGGGTVFDGPREIPGGFTLKCFDPQGTMFALSSVHL